MPNKISRPFPMAEMVCSSTLTLALETRWSNARINGNCYFRFVLLDLVARHFEEFFLLSGAHVLILETYCISADQVPIFLDDHPIHNSPQWNVESMIYMKVRIVCQPIHHPY